MFYRLSPTTIYYRLFLPAPRVPHWAEHFAALFVGHENGCTLVAVIQDEVVGVANYGRSGSGRAAGDEAELGVVIEDAWQRRGIGRALTARLARMAAQRGIGVFHARILGENRRALRFVTRLFASAVVRLEDGEYAVRIRLPRA
jgi:RimJ/RimL family protein N-acetyltransferase